VTSGAARAVRVPSATLRPSSTGSATASTARSLFDGVLTLLVVLALPIVFVLGAPLVFLAWLVVVTAQRIGAHE